MEKIRGGERREGKSNIISCAAVLGASTFDESISSAIETRRVHHQLLPDLLRHESKRFYHL